MNKEAGKLLYNDIEIRSNNLESDYFRLIPTRRPYVNLYERIISADKTEALLNIEAMTNPRVREAYQKTDIIKKQDSYKGGNRHLIEASFLYLSESRFSDSTFGIFYAAKELDTAIEETKYHKAKFYASTKESPFVFQMSLLEGEIKANMHDIREKIKGLEEIYSPSSWTKSQNFGCFLKSNNSNGVIYNSVRHKRGTCFGIFKPNKIKSIKETKFISYYWNGEKITLE